MSISLIFWSQGEQGRGKKRWFRESKITLLLQWLFPCKRSGESRSGSESGTCSLPRLPSSARGWEQLPTGAPHLHMCALMCAQQGSPCHCVWKLSFSGTPTHRLPCSWRSRCCHVLISEARFRIKPPFSHGPALKSRLIKPALNNPHITVSLVTSSASKWAQLLPRWLVYQWQQVKLADGADILARTFATNPVKQINVGKWPEKNNLNEESFLYVLSGCVRVTTNDADNGNGSQTVK